MAESPTEWPEQDTHEAAIFVTVVVLLTLVCAGVALLLVRVARLV